MKLSKFLLLLSLVTAFSLLYVYQQTQIFHFAYTGQKKLTVFQDLLDKNTILRYNITRNTSLTRIGNKVSMTSDFEMPDTYRLVKLTHPLTELKVAQQMPKKETLLSRLFGVKQEAEAKTINPVVTKH